MLSHKFVHRCNFTDSLASLMKQMNADIPGMNLATTVYRLIFQSCTYANFIFKVILK